MALIARGQGSPPRGCYPAVKRALPPLLRAHSPKGWPGTAQRGWRSALRLFPVPSGAQVRLRRPLSRSTWCFPVQLPSSASSDCCGPPARPLSPSLLLQQRPPVRTPVCAGRIPAARFPLVSAELRAFCCYSAAGGEAVESGGETWGQTGRNRAGLSAADASLCLNIQKETV